MCFAAARRARLAPNGWIPSPPGTPSGDPSVIPVLDPPDRWNAVKRRHPSPASPQLPHRPVDSRRPLELLSTRLDRPGRPVYVITSQAQALDQPRLLVRPRIDPARSIVALDPAREANSQPALAVVAEDQPTFGPSPELQPP